MNDITILSYDCWSSNRTTHEQINHLIENFKNYWEKEKYPDKTQKEFSRNYILGAIEALFWGNKLTNQDFVDFVIRLEAI